MSETFESSEILKHKVITATTSIIFIYLYFLIILTFFESSTPELNFLRELNADPADSAFDYPAPFVATEFASVLRFGAFAVFAMRRLKEVLGDSELPRK